MIPLSSGENVAALFADDRRWPDLELLLLCAS